MGRKFICLVIAACCIPLLVLPSGKKLYAQQSDSLRARVLGINDAPVSMASAFLLKSPLFSTVSDDGGYLEFSPEICNSPDDTLLVSYIGYELYKISVSDLIREVGKHGTAEIRLKVHEIMEARVAEKAGRISKRKAMKNLLSLVMQRMRVDFPLADRSYKVKSDFYVYNGEAVVGMDEAVGTMYENYGNLDSLRKITDSLVVFKVDSRNYYMDSDVRKIIDRATDTARIALKGNADRSTRKLVEKSSSVMKRLDMDNIMHEAFWGGNPVFIMEKLVEKPRRWESSILPGGSTVLVYNEKKNYLGILKYNLQVTLVVDSKDYRVSNISQNLDVYINIPFGYKLEGEELEMFNLLNINHNRMEKFRVKKMEGTIKRTSSFMPEGNVLVPVRKTMSSHGTITDRKGKGMRLDNEATVTVLR